MKKIASLGGSIIGLLVGMAVGWGLPYPLPPSVSVTPAGAPIERTATTSSVLVDFGDGRVVTYAGVPVAAGETVAELMADLERSRELTLAWKDYGGDLGKLVTAIGDVASDPKAGRFWSYWVNNRFAEVGISQFRLQPSDQVMWKYTTNQFRAETK